MDVFITDHAAKDTRAEAQASHSLHQQQALHHVQNLNPISLCALYFQD